MKELKKELVAAFKQNGLDEITEETAVKACKAFFSVLRAMVPRLSNGLGMIITPMTYHLEQRMLELIDDIDGKDNPDY